jgi:fatty acid-binding protein DegV
LRTISTTEKLVELMKEHTDTTKPLHVMVHYTDGIVAGEHLKELVTSKYNCVEVHLTPYTPVMASQTGPVIAVSFYSN